VRGKIKAWNSIVLLSPGSETHLKIEWFDFSPPNPPQQGEGF